MARRKRQVPKGRRKVCDFCGGLCAGHERRWTTARFVAMANGDPILEEIGGYLCGWCAISLADEGWEVVRHGSE